MRIQLKERAVILVCFHNNILALIINMKVAAKVLANASKERRTANACMAQQVRYKRTRGCFAMAACYSDAFFSARQLTENLGTFLHLHATLLQHDKLLQILRNCRSVYNQVNIIRYEGRVVTIMDTYSLFLQFLGKR